MTTDTVTPCPIPDVPSRTDRNHRFVIGLIAGSVVGVGLGMLFAPRAVLDLRKRAGKSTRRLGHAAADRYQQASTHLGDVVDEITKKGQGLRDDLSDAVVRGAHDVERRAKKVMSGH